LAEAATRTFAPGSKHRRAATGRLNNLSKSHICRQHQRHIVQKTAATISVCFKCFTSWNCQQKFLLVLVGLFVASVCICQNCTAFVGFCQLLSVISMTDANTWNLVFASSGVHYYRTPPTDTTECG